MDRHFGIRNFLAPFLPLELVLNILYEFKAIETPSCRAVKNLINKNHNCISIIPKKNMYFSNKYNIDSVGNKNKYVYFGMNYENNILKVAQILKQ